MRAGRVGHGLPCPRCRTSVREPEGQRTGTRATARRLGARDYVGPTRPRLRRGHAERDALATAFAAVYPAEPIA
jgi:hypothetical protein